MSEKILYLNMDAKVKTKEEMITIGKLGKLYSSDSQMVNKVKTLKVYRFQLKDKNRCVISALKVIELIHQQFPGCIVNIVGETETIVELANRKRPPAWIINLKIAFVAAICFFGTMYTIMAYHNEINITIMFEQIFWIVTGRESDGFTTLEAFYSLGLSLGIILFYNHIGKRRLTPDPSPVEVEMRGYEDEVNVAIVEMANREEKTIDVS